MTTQILIAGFGGQGVLFAGKILAYKGLVEGKQLSWLPSYGPEMRGGTANCSVIFSDEPVGSPIVANPDVLVVMNQPSLDKYEKAVVPGGTIFVDSTMVNRRVERTDVKVFYIPATQLAKSMGAASLANMVITGKLIKECGAVAYEGLDQALGKVISTRKAGQFDLNMKALNTGYEY